MDIEQTPDSTNHTTTLPIALPNLEHLSNTELSSIRGYIGLQTREARKVSNKVIASKDSLRDLWMKTLSLRSDATPEERSRVVMDFERELLRFPEAFVKYALANSLFLLDTEVKEEMLRRSRIEPTRPKRKVAP